MSARIRRKPGSQPGNKPGQASLELALAITCILLLLLGSLQIFVWVNKSLVLRQEEYEESRDPASGEPAQVDEAQFPALNILR